MQDEEKPEILIDMATLTGAHRVALGTDLPGIFTDDERLAADIAEASAAIADYTWCGALRITRCSIQPVVYSVLRGRL